MSKFFLTTISLLYIQICIAQIKSVEYLGQTPPDSTPVIFAPDIVSVNGRYEYGLSISPDGNEIYFSADSPGDGLTVVKRIDGKWTKPETANLRGSHSWEFEAFFTNDGNKLYFTSDTGELPKFWYMERGKNYTGKVKYLDSPINDSPGMWCTFTKDETIYYGNNSNFQIHRAKLADGKYSKPENLGFNGFHPFIAPDESFFLFNSGRYGGYGKSDILIVFRKEDESWSQPVNIGDKINTGFDETCASLSPDGRYLFFSRYDEPGEKSNIYWARADNLIQSLKEKEKSLKSGNLPVTIGTYHTIHSIILGEDRTLLIRLPEDYNKSDKKYPVLFKLDGDKGVFLHTVSAVRYLVDMTDKIPDHIIVGIENTDRNRDMEPGKGADNFIKFIGTELLPLIEKNYRTNGFNIMCGQSYSALFAGYLFLKEPELFHGFILASFGLYKDSLAIMFKDELTQNQNIKKAGKRYLFVALGKLDSYDPDGSITNRGMKFMELLKRSAPEVQIESKLYEDEGHVPFPSVYDGLKWIYTMEKYKLQ